MIKPKIRFKGFEGEWKKVSFLSLFDILKNNSLTRAELNGVEGDVICIHYGDVLIKYGDLLDVNNEEVCFISDAKKANILYSNSPLKEGDVIIADAAEDSTVGKCVELINISEMKVVAGLHTIPCRPKLKMAAGFIGHYLNSSAYHNQLLPLIQGTKISSISKKTLSLTYLMRPSFSEQQSIASFFTTIDAQISASTSRLASLKQIKAASLQAMFPQEGETVPKLRFKGFEGEWKTSLVGEVCKISTGKSNTQDKIEDGEFPFYVRSPYVERSNKYLYDEEAVLTVGDGVGTGKVFHYVNGKYDLHQRVYRMFDFHNIQAKYFYYLFSTQFYKRVMSMTAKSSVDSVRMDMIADMKINVPAISEQQSIASYFTNLDRQITLQTNRLEKLKQIKAACLDKMFV